MDEMLARILECMGPGHGAGKELADFLGVSPNVITNWKNGSNRSYRKYLSLIAEHYGVTVDYLLTGKQKENPTAKSDEVTFDDFTYALHNQSKELNDANKEKLLDMARMLKLAQDAQKNK